MRFHRRPASVQAPTATRVSPTSVSACPARRGGISQRSTVRKIPAIAMSEACPAPQAADTRRTSARDLPCAAMVETAARWSGSSAWRAPSRAPYSAMRITPPSPTARSLGDGIEFLVHPELDALTPDRRLVFLPDMRVLVPVRDRVSAFLQVHGVLVEDLFPRPAGFAPGAPAEWSEPGHQPQRIPPHTKMLMEVLTAHWCGADHADGFIVLAQHLLRLACFPGARADFSRPRVGVALARAADQHCCGLVRVGLRVPSGFMLSDPMVEDVLGQVGLQAAESGRAAVVQGEGDMDSVGDDGRLHHG